MSEPITLREIFEKVYALPPHIRQEAEWVMSSETFDQIKKYPEFSVELFTGTLLGRPVRVESDAKGVKFQQPRDRPKRITGQKFLEALAEAGIIKGGEYVRRVVIDAQIDDPTRVYVERIGDDRLLNVALGLSGIEVTEVGGRDATALA